MNTENIINQDDEYIMKPENEHFLRLQKHHYKLYSHKNQEYNDSYKEYGIVGLLTILNNKMNRAIHISASKIEVVKFESLEDNLTDISNYCILALMELEKYKK